VARFAGPVGVAAAAVVVGLAAGWWAAGLFVLSCGMVEQVVLRRRLRAAIPVRRRRVWTDEERRFILDRDGWQCVYCGATEELQIDHVVPFSRGGACSIDNAAVLCGPCNRSKGAT